MDNNCLNCERFVWWDGDYCCLANFTILCSSNKKGDFTDEIFHTLRTEDTCVDWKKNENDLHTKMYQESYENFLKKKDTLA